MPNFKCDACDYEFGDMHNIASCPSCAGLGKPEKKCTCSYYRNGLGVKLNVISRKNPDCPVHGEKEK